MEIVRVLHCKHKVPNCQIAVLTPYKAQKEKIKDKLKQGEPDDLKNIQVESISESQGRLAPQSFCIYLCIYILTWCVTNTWLLSLQEMSMELYYYPQSGLNQ